MQFDNYCLWPSRLATSASQARTLHVLGVQRPIDTLAHRPLKASTSRRLALRSAFTAHVPILPRPLPAYLITHHFAVFLSFLVCILV